MKLSSILNEYGLNPNRTKLVRHAYSNPRFRAAYDLNFLEAYQNSQSSQRFKNTDCVLVFLGKSGNQSIFLGCYSVGEVLEGSDKRILMPPGYPNPEEYESGFYYNLTLNDKMADLINRLVIDWGKPTPSNWCQLASKKDKMVLEIRPEKYTGNVKEFKSFEETLLSFTELKEITSDPVLYKDWNLALSSINAIYLILDTKTGKQYVGSTYGQDGLLGRWKAYADTKHGGDEGIKAVLKKSEIHIKHFQFTILRVLPKTITADEAIRIESLYKEKLGTRQFGMNQN